MQATKIIEAAWAATSAKKAKLWLRIAEEHQKRVELLGNAEKSPLSALARKREADALREVRKIQEELSSRTPTEDKT